MTQQCVAAGVTVWDPIRIGDVCLRNRFGLAPMSQYQAPDGAPNEWHWRHYAHRAHAVGIVIVEATAVSRESRVTPYDLFLTPESRIEPWQRLVHEIRSAGAVPCLQLAHAGRKASRSRPWDGDRPIPLADGGWQPVGPSNRPFAPGQLVPRALSTEEIAEIPEMFARSARCAIDAGFEMVELHAGHGRLLHSFYSPVANDRTDAWGGSVEGRSRLLLETTAAVRATLPPRAGLAVRLSCTDWLASGWQLSDTLWLADRLRQAGCQMIDCSSGGVVQPVDIPRAPHYQVDFATQVRRACPIVTAAVGEITEYREARRVVASGEADLVLMGRRLLVDPYYLARESNRPELLPSSYRRALTSGLAVKGTAEW